MDPRQKEMYYPTVNYSNPPSQVPYQASYIEEQPGQTYEDNLPKYTLDRTPSFDPPPELGDDFVIGKKELKDAGLANQKAQICVLLDVSRSMQNPNKFFNFQGRDRVQEALNRILALSFSLDDNRQIEIIPFAGKAYNIITIDRSNYKNATAMVLQSLQEAGLTPPNIYWNLKEDTNYAAAIKAVRKHFFNEDGPRQKIHPSNDLPVFAILLTDGNHNDEEEEAEKQFIYASYQNIFIKSFGLMGAEFKDKNDKQVAEKFEFLQSMDDAKSSSKNTPIKQTSPGFFNCCFDTSAVEEKESQFCIDNNDFEPIVDPSKITMKELIKEFRGWLQEAHKIGISKKPPRIDDSVKFEDEGRVQLKK